MGEKISDHLNYIIYFFVIIQNYKIKTFMHKKDQQFKV